MAYAHPHRQSAHAPPRVMPYDGLTGFAGTSHAGMAMPWCGAGGRRLERGRPPGQARPHLWIKGNLQSRLYVPTSSMYVHYTFRHTPATATPAASLDLHKPLPSHAVRLDHGLSLMAEWPSSLVPRASPRERQPCSRLIGGASAMPEPVWADKGACLPTEWTRPHHCGHMWELAVPHLSSRFIDFKGLARGQFYTSSCSFLCGDLYFQALLNTRKVRRNYFPHVSCVIWPSPPRSAAEPLGKGDFVRLLDHFDLLQTAMN
jgi:hypothetical protein